MKTNWFKATIALIVGTFAVVALQPKSDAGPGHNKVTLCHKGQTLELPEPAVQAHLGHGDTLGPCSITPSKNQ
jgi:hypothetical protein